MPPWWDLKWLPQASKHLKGNTSEKCEIFFIPKTPRRSGRLSKITPLSFSESCEAPMKEATSHCTCPPPQFFGKPNQFYILHGQKCVMVTQSIHVHYGLICGCVYYVCREKLASLFGLDQAASQGNESFQFTAPRQPKRSSSILGMRTCTVPHTDEMHPSRLTSWE